jgi:hypothetical protein
MKKQMLWKNVQIGQMVYYGDELLEKYKSDRARAKSDFGKCGTHYSPDEMVEVEIEEKPAVQAQQKQANDWNDAPATPRQRQYLVDLGVNIAGKQISKKQASELIDGAKSGSIGHLGFFFTDGSN